MRGTYHKNARYAVNGRKLIRLNGTVFRNECYFTQQKHCLLLLLFCENVSTKSIQYAITPQGGTNKRSRCLILVSCSLNSTIACWKPQMQFNDSSYH